MILPKAILVLFTLSFSFSYANDCSTVRIDYDPVVLKGYQTTQQLGPSCYVHAAANMISAYLSRETKENRKLSVSAQKIWTRLNNNNELKKENILDANTGRTCNTIEYIKQRCRASDNRSEKNDSLKSKINHITYSLERLLFNANFTNSDIRRSIIRACDLDPSIRAAVSKLPTCKIFDGDRTSNSFTLKTPDEFAQKLNSQLNAPHPMPVGIEYCSGILTNPKISYITNRNFHSDLNYLNTSDSVLNLHPACGFHASTIVGRKKALDGQCYFLVQNSWGKSCGYGAECENGKIWVSESALTHNLIRISTLEN